MPEILQAVAAALFSVVATVVGLAFIDAVLGALGGYDNDAN